MSKKKKEKKDKYLQETEVDQPKNSIKSVKKYSTWIKWKGKEVLDLRKFKNKIK